MLKQSNFIVKDDNNVNDIVKSMETELDQKLIVRKISKDNRKKTCVKKNGKD